MLTDVQIRNAKPGPKPIKPLIGWYDYGSSVSRNSGESLTVGFDGTNGVLQLT